MDNDKITINNLHHEELNSQIYDIVYEVKNKFGIKEKIFVIITDDEKSYQTGLSGGLKSQNLNYKLQWEYDGEIIIRRGVLKKIDLEMDLNEFKALIAHECSHIYHADSILILKFYCVWFALSIISAMDTELFTKNFLLAIIVFISTFIIGAQMAFYCRRMVEKRCDREAVFITKNPDALKEGLKKLHVEFDDVIKIAKTNEKPMMYLRKVRYFILGDTHPKFSERMEFIDNLKLEISY